MCLKTIFGHHLSYEQILGQYGVQTLTERRSNAFDKLAMKIKIAKNERFSSWLPKQEFKRYGLRTEHIYKEKYA